MGHRHHISPERSAWRRGGIALIFVDLRHCMGDRWASGTLENIGGWENMADRRRLCSRAGA